jgi:C1A family cysteine protease
MESEKMIKKTISLVLVLVALVGLSSIAVGQEINNASVPSNETLNLSENTSAIMVSQPIINASAISNETLNLSENVSSTVGAQNTSTSQAAVDGQTSERLTKAPLNPVWLEYEQNLTAGKAMTKTTATGNSLGHVPSPVDISYLKGKMVAGVANTYAESYDLRTVDKVTSVKNQNPYGTCWAFATFGSLESYLLTPETRNFAEYNLAKQSGFDIAWDAGGNRYMSTAYLSRWGGPVNELDDPYPGGDVHLPNNNAYTIQKHTQDVLWLPERISSTDNDNIKWGLTTYGGLDVSIYWNDLYYLSSPATYYNPSDTSANHEVTLVGWDDNYAATNFQDSKGAPPGNGAFIAKNSWGTLWGDGGYFYLSYYDTSLQEVTAYTAEPISNYAAVYQYDPLGVTDGFGYGSTIAWGANVFTADASTNPLAAVSFYTFDLNTQYEVYIYTNPTSGPIGGTQYVGPKGTIPMAGYHTIKLESPVPLSSGQRFSVVVKFTAPKDLYPVYVEYALPGWSSGATASPGQSYISSTGSAWQDITTFESTANVCIKAFTSAPVVVNHPPTVPAIPSGPNSGTSGTSYSYSTSATDPDEDLVTYTFDWGDGTTSSAPQVGSGVASSVFHTWTVPAGSTTTFSVRAKTTDVHGMDSPDPVWSNPLSVTITGAPNVPAIPSGPSSSSPGSCNSYSTSATDPDGYQVKYTFDWGDGSIAVSSLVDSGTSASASHIWNTAGTYQVKSMATDSKGATSGWSNALTVTISSNNPPNTPSIPSGPTSGLPGTTYSYSTSAADPDGDKVKYTFDWGDGTTQTETGLVDSETSASLDHIWSTAGTYQVKSMATDSKGATSGWSNALTITISVPNNPPATPSVPSGTRSGRHGTTYSYSTSAADPDGDKVKYTFDWGDGTTQTETGLVNSGNTASSSHSWARRGTYLVKAMATDSKSASSGWSTGLTVKII